MNATVTTNAATDTDGNAPATLGEALLSKSAMDTVLVNLKERIHTSAKTVEGRKPAEDAISLLRKAEAVIEERRRLVLKINAANQNARLGSGRTLSEPLSLRESLRTRIGLVTELIRHAVPAADHMFGSDHGNIVASVDVAALELEREELSKELRDANASVQKANWEITL